MLLFTGGADGREDNDRSRDRSRVFHDKLSAAAGVLAGASLHFFQPKSNNLRIFFCSSFFVHVSRQGPFSWCCSRPAGPAVRTRIFSPHSRRGTLIEASYLTVFSFS